MWQEFKDYTELDRKKLVQLTAYPFYILGELLNGLFWIIAGKENSSLFYLRALLGLPIIPFTYILEGIENKILKINSDNQDE